MIGTVVGNFRIVAQLGKGGMGEVWLAEQQSLRTKVAIKILRADVSADVSHVKRFFNEAIAVDQIHHAGIVKIFDCGHVGAQAYLVMELLVGETLTRRIARARRLPLAQVCDIGRQVASVLDATHAAGIIHRDLKPDNVFLVPDAERPSGERAKVLDFGIAKLGTVGITSTSVGSMGTPLYMSPEQWRSVAKVDGRADAYSLGCVVFEMACGRPPFPADSMGEACAQHLNDPPPVPSSIVPALPPAFDRLALGLLEKDPARRPTLREVMAELDAIAQALPPEARALAVHGPHAASSSPPLPDAPVAASAATVVTADGLAPVAASAPTVATAGGLAPPPTGLALARTSQPTTPPPTAPPAASTTLGGAAGTVAPAGARRGRAGMIAAGIVVVGVGAVAGVLAVRAGNDAGDDPGETTAPVQTPATALDAAPPSPDAPVPEPPPGPAPEPPPGLKLVFEKDVSRVSGEPPKSLRSAVKALLCIDSSGAVTSADVDLRDPKAAEELETQLRTWHYVPFRDKDAAIPVCFQTTLLPRATSPQPGSGSGKSPGGGSGAGSGSSKPPGSGKPPPPPIPEKLGHAEFVTVMKQLEPSLQGCRPKRRHNRRPAATVTVTVTVTVAPGGNVVDLRRSALGPNLAQCLEDTIRGARFPATKQGGQYDHSFKL